MTVEAFYENPYQKICDATITAIAETSIQLDRTIFYPEGGGQPGDTGRLVCEDGTEIRVNNTIKVSGAIQHLTEPFSNALKVGDKVTGRIDWERRNRHMRYHTCLHLLCAVVPHPVTGGSINENKARLDFDMPETIDKEAVTTALNELIEANHPVEIQWITDAEMQANMELVRTMSVQPPMGQGKIRLVHVKGIDLQPCGGTHLASTGEIGKIRLGKVEKKGKQNRRVNILFDE